MTSKYPLVLGVQLTMLVVDLVFNAATVLLFGNSIVLLMIHILQDTLILLSVIVLVIAFSSTFVFQAGLIFLLFRRFAPAIVAAFVYLATSVGLHYITLVSSPFLLFFSTLVISCTSFPARTIDKQDKISLGTISR
ncbi:unnamed protein product [Nippostrongylus brasiliensis]|uniref:Transmembrane protein 138 n=1 Tax=Nippostrongylus brasiliensis TaxID=27835 RepID=A0A0N4YBQ9_NIPBR|nr:unnamed protein product [Nippostrongylus brasiliensis]